MIPRRLATRGTQSMEMWGGVECTVNRVGDQYFDQIARSGHMSRLDDLDRFAELGITALRFPLLWNHVQPERDQPPDWSWPDRALERLRQLGVRPIVGLLHHGFGPRWVSARDPAFVHLFARYARQVAERYPWIDAYTPLNEPLTTARFSGLYGHWHPHARDDTSFVALFLAQLSATARAMREIRAVNPRAELVQTEDLGKVESTPALEPQRDFENARRWLTWDILSGTLTREHPCWNYLESSYSGFERELELFADGASAPQLIGINHYITSERYLDERVDRYSLDEIGGNGREVYADVAQVQVPFIARAGLGELLREAWDRYRRPIAVTECHMGCTREEQMRWLHEVWQTGMHAREAGIDVRAITSWALLGSFDWNSLVTRETGHYESGAFDARGPSPRATALATMMRALANDGRYAHPVLSTPGWWKRRDGSIVVGPPLVIYAAGGELGRALADECASRGLAHVLRHTLESARDAIEAQSAWAVICANVDGAEAAAIAESCGARGSQFVSCAHGPGSDSREDVASVNNSFASALDAADDGSSPQEAEATDRFGQLVILGGEEVNVRDLARATLELLLDGQDGPWHLDIHAGHASAAPATGVGALWGRELRMSAAARR
jgi:dTDP-4-dehydrorhamnose reductase